MTMPKFKEKVLLFKVRRFKDKGAFGELYDLYIDTIYRFIYFKVSSREEAEDLTSETFLRLWNYLIESEERINNLRPFIYKVARNIIVDFYRKNRDRELENSGEMPFDIPDEQKSIFEKLAVKDEVENIERAIRSIKMEYREVILMRYIESLTISEIAVIIGKSRGATRVLIHRAINTLRELLNNQPDE